MRIICLSCGHKVELDDAYDDFEGQVKCVACTALLEIKTEEGMLKGIKVAEPLSRPAAPPQGTRGAAIRY
jgi:hypothetical protein